MTAEITAAPARKSSAAKANPTPFTAEKLNANYAADALTASRLGRNESIAAAANLVGPFTIVRAENRPASEPKFNAFITGAAGRNGWVIADRDGTERVTGETTVTDLITIGAITNPEKLAVTVAGKAVRVKIHGL